jgi:hypothetical protein
MRRLILPGLLFAAALSVLLFFLLKGQSPFGKRNSSFACEPVKEITKIELSEGDKSLRLEKSGSKWLVNSGAEARKGGISFLTSILTEIRIKSTVSEELFENQISVNNIEPVIVRVYEKKKLLKKLIVYKTASNRYGNIMKINSGSKPFIVYLPGFEGDIGSVFTVNESYWKPFVVFNMLPSEIASVELHNFADTASSFKIVNKQGRFHLTENYKGSIESDSSRVMRYISYFTFIPFDEWSADPADDIAKKSGVQEPLYRISVTGLNGQLRILDLWERTLTGDKGSSADTDRLLGKIKGEDNFFVIRYFDIDPLLKKKTYFLPR